MKADRKIDLLSTLGIVCYLNILKVAKVEVHCRDDIEGKICLKFS